MKQFKTKGERTKIYKVNKQENEKSWKENNKVN